MPTAARELHGLAGYGWAFTGFLVANVVGMVRVRPDVPTGTARRPLLAGLALFLAGLLPGRSRRSMAQLVAGRASRARRSADHRHVRRHRRAYAEQARPRLFAAISAAWVSGAGRPGAGRLVTEPVLALGVPWARAVRGRGRRLAATVAAAVAPPGPPAPARPGRIGSRRLATARRRRRASGRCAPGWPQLPVAGGRVGRSVIGLRGLLPRGTVASPPRGAGRGRRSAACWRASSCRMESLVPLTLTRRCTYSPTLAGTPLMLGALGWATASTVQGRPGTRSAPALVRPGFGLLARRRGGMALVGQPACPAAWSSWSGRSPASGWGCDDQPVSVVLLEHHRAGAGRSRPCSCRTRRSAPSSGWPAP